MALSSDAEQILVLAQHLPPDDKLELAERLIADVRQHPPRVEDKNELPETEQTHLTDVTDPDFDFANLPMVGIWSDRNDMNDPVEWVRTMRQREWGGRE
jgi:hypothetical protein